MATTAVINRVVGVSTSGRNASKGLEETLEHSSVRHEAFDLLEAVVRDAWAEQGETAREANLALALRHNELTERSDHLVDAFLHDGIIDRETYERERVRIDQELRDLEAQAQAHTADEIDLDRTIEFARSMLTDLPGCWNRLSWTQRPAFLRSLFPDGMVCENDSIGKALVIDRI